MKIIVINSVGPMGSSVVSALLEKYGSSDYATHHLLMCNNIVILEGLDLSKIYPGDYELIALPLKLKGADGSPARVVLREIE